MIDEGRVSAIEARAVGWHTAVMWLSRAATACEKLRVKRVAEGVNRRTADRREWQQGAHAMSRVFKRLRAKPAGTMSCMRKGGGSYTADVGELDGMLRSKWDAVFAC